MANTGNPTESACRFSTRISLRWLPEPAHETTDTIVMSVKDWYLDLRMDKQTGEIDWAIAGQRIIESQEPRLSHLARSKKSPILANNLFSACIFHPRTRLSRCF